MENDVVLEGVRVRLVPASPDHLDGLFRASHHSEIWTYSPSSIGKPEDLEAVMRQWMKAKSQGQRYPFVIIDKLTSEIVGSTSYLNMSPKHRNLEIGGTWLDPKVWRTRVNTECKYLLLAHGFESMGLVRVQFRTDARNERSNRAIRRIGARFEGTLRQEMIMHDGYKRDSHVYSILDTEWGEVRAGLLDYLNDST